MPRSIQALLITTLAALTAAPAALAIEFDDIDIPYEEFTLDNGLRVIVHTDRKAPIVSMITWYHVGSKDEPENRTGFAHLFEHLMFQGSANHEGDYFAPLSEVGATGINGTTTFDRTAYFQTVPTGALERMLWLESDRMTHLLGAVDQATLDEQRSVVQNEKRQGENRAWGNVWDTVFRGLFSPGHPYQHPVIGTMEDLDAATLDDVRDWFETYYGASNVVIVLAGDIDAATARPLIEKYYADAPAGQPLTRIARWVPRLTENRHEVIHDQAASGFIRRSWAVPSTPRESVGLALWSTAFARGRTAPLYQALVEEHRLASFVQASPVDYELSGVFSIDVQLLPDADVEEARRVLDETLAEFLVTGPDPERLERQRVQSLTGIIRGYESVRSKAETLITGAVFADDPARYRQFIAQVQAATSESLSALANEWLTRPYYELTGVPFSARSGSGVGDGAGEADRSRLPDAEASATLPFPEIEERELGNGIRVVLARRDVLPVTDLVFRFEAGSAGEAPDERGLTDTAFEQLTSGTTSRDAEELSIEMEGLGTFLRATGGTLSSSLSAGGLTERLPQIIALAADVLSNPTYPEDQLALQTERWVASIRQDRTQSNSLARAALEESVFGAEHPYGRQMTEEAVERIGRGGVVQYHASRIKGQPFTVFAVGDVTMDDLAGWLQDAFADWAAGQPDDVPASRPPTVTPAPPAESPSVLLIDMPNSPQSVILAGLAAGPTPIEPDAPTAIANDVFGGGFVSRLNLNLREDKGWSYGAGAFVDTDPFQRIFMLSTSVQADRTADAVAEIRRELAEYIGDRPATPEEFTLAQERRLRSRAGQFETGRALLTSLLASAGMNRPWDYPVHYGEALQSVTLDEVHAAARELIHPERLTWVIAGDLSLFEEQVRALEIGEVIEIDEFGQPVDAGAPD